MSPLRETSKDPFSGDCSCRQDGLTVIITACLTFAMGVTVALIMQIYFGDPQVRQNMALQSGFGSKNRCDSTPNCLRSLLLRLGVVLREASGALSACPRGRAWQGWGCCWRQTGSPAAESPAVV